MPKEINPQDLGEAVAKALLSPEFREKIQEARQIFEEKMKTKNKDSLKL